MKIFYQPNGGISAVPDLSPVYDLKVFGCETPQDYNNGNILFPRESNAIARFVEEVTDFKPEVILIETLSPEMITAIRKTRKSFTGPIILFYGDLMEKTTFMLLEEICKYIDLALVLDKNTEKKMIMKGAPVKYTLQPASSLLYQPQMAAEKNTMLFLQGTWT